MITQKLINDVAYKIVGGAIEVHKQLGPGLLESVYQKCLCEELRFRGLQVQTEVLVPVVYRKVRLSTGRRLDLLVEDLIIVELKAVETMIPLYTAQLLSYLKLASKPKGLLINFQCENIVKQVVPLVTDIFASYPKEEILN